jgi:ATP-dependent DNA helicase RecG
VETRIFTPARRPEALALLGEALDRGRQAYVVYPVIEESETLDLASANRGYQELREKIFPGRTVGLVHGRLPERERDRTLEEFRAGRIALLVSTTVVEVGIDVPNAAVLLVENAERFGLAQLHQLRGRVGRSPHPARCLLVASEGAAAGRLRVLAAARDGLKIAEEDLRMRGPGEVFGASQHGFIGFRIADPARDISLLARAREAARALVQADPRLELSGHVPLRRELERRGGEGFDAIQG